MSPMTKPDLRVLLHQQSRQHQQKASRQGVDGGQSCVCVCVCMGAGGNKGFTF